MEKDKLHREKLMRKEFGRARESLESAVRRQNVKLGEVFGNLDTHTQESLARKMYVKSTALPQPVEMHVRFMRAVKSKLPKGAYVVMLSQYESLGGRPLAWSQIGSYGIGEDYPATTKAVKHQGRYFDRLMRFEDSCFALCPPPQRLQPGFAFLIEVFQLKSRFNPEDKPVAWTAVPMCTESLQIIEGKLKLPLIKGAQPPTMNNYRSMEEAICENIDNWLCNIYVDFRRFSLSDMEADYVKMNLHNSNKNKGVHHIVKLNRYLNFDFLNKRVGLQDGKGQYVMRIDMSMFMFRGLVLYTIVVIFHF